MKNIYLIVGESGSGKTTIADRLSEVYGWRQIESFTTRPPRRKNEVGHIFVTEKDVPDKSDMVAYTLYNGNHYWATHEQVEVCDLYVIDPKGIDFFKKTYKGNKGVKVVQISVDEFARARRMYDRGDDYQAVIERINLDRKAFAKVKSDKKIENQDLVQSTLEFYHYVMRCEA